MKILGNSTFLKVETFKQCKRLHGKPERFSILFIIGERQEDEPGEISAAQIINFSVPFSVS